jgi:hypothetical protein
MEIDELVERIRREHCAFPPATATDLERVKAFALPDDLLRFYELTDGAMLYASEFGTPGPDSRQWDWWIRSAADLLTVAEYGFVPEDSPLYESAQRWVVWVEVQDGNVLAVNTEPNHVGEIIDCFHETVGDVGWNSIVALSCTEALRLLLADRSPFWPADDRPKYGAY